MAVTKTLDYYLSLPYPIVLIPDPEEQVWYVRIPLLPGCMTDGRTPAEALKSLDEAKTLWFEVALEDGDDIAEPGPPEKTLTLLDSISFRAA